MDHIIRLIAAIDTHEMQIPEGAAIIPMALFALLIIAIFFGSVVGWITIIIAKLNNYPLPLRLESHSPPPWGIIDVLLVFAFWFVTQIGTGIVLRLAHLLPPTDPSSDAAPSMRIMSLVQSITLLTVIVGTVWLLSWFKSRSQMAGWSCRHLLYDVLLGGAVFVLTAPMLYGLMAVATLLTKQEYNHPLIEAVGKDPSNIALAFWVAVITAPIIEEFGFRVLLQGYFQSLAEKSSLSKLMIALVGRGRIEGKAVQDLELPHSINQTNTSSSESTSVAINTNNLPSNVTLATNQSPSVSTKPEWRTVAWLILVAAIASRMPYFYYSAIWKSVIFLLFGCLLGLLFSKANRWPIILVAIAFGLLNFNFSVSWLPPTFFSVGCLWGWLLQNPKLRPILLSGPLFGLAHFDYGASWIPLVFFGCVLGWLYQKTNRIWPSLTAHMFCNFIGVTGIVMQTLSGIHPPN